MQTYFISGNDPVVEHFIAQVLATSTHQICYLTLSGQHKITLADDSRIKQIEGNPTQPLFGLDKTMLGELNIDQLWHFNPAGHADSSVVEQLTTLCNELTGVTFNYVGSAYATADTNEKHLQADGALQHRIFRPSMLLAGANAAQPQTPLNQWLKAVVGLKRQVEAKSDKYFSRFPLQLVLPADASVNMLAVDEACARMLAIASSDSNNAVYHITSEQNTPMSQVVKAITDATGLAIKVVANTTTFMSPDTLLQTLAGDSYQTVSGNLVFTDADSQALAPAQSAAIDLMGVVKAMQQNALDNHQTPSAIEQSVSASLQSKQLTSANGKLDYFTCGEGEKSLFIVNAFGLNLTFWSPLIALLSEQYKVIFWQHRDRQNNAQLNNVYYDADNDIETFVADAKAIIDTESHGACHLLSWCSGPKLAMELAARHPELVDALTLLTPSFPGVSGFDKSHDSAFEKNLVTMCSLINKMPHAANSIVTSMAALRAKEAGDLNRFDPVISKDKTISVFSLPDESFAPLLYQPFTDGPSIVGYSRQLVNFRAHDVAQLVAKVPQPTLLLTGGDDTTTSSPRAITLCQQLPQVLGYEINGGNHYLHTEKPELIAGLISDFINQGMAMNVSDHALKKSW